MNLVPLLKAMDSKKPWLRVIAWLMMILIGFLSVATMIVFIMKGIWAPIIFLAILLGFYVFIEWKHSDERYERRFMKAWHDRHRP